MNDKVKEIINNCGNLAIVQAYLKADNVLNRPIYKNIMVSISGGSDSDIMVDMIQRIKPNAIIRYVFFDTGLEYDATKRHLDDLEKKYNITIERVKPQKTIPMCVHEFGIPFKSKLVSETMGRLQAKGFKWEDEDFSILMDKYPNSLTGLKWWCNIRQRENGTRSTFCIDYYRMLKEFIISSPPEFRISANCCTYTKKKTSKEYIKQNDIDLTIIGVRKAEGGVRSFAYKNCFSDNSDNNKPDEFRPIFYMTNQDKAEYKKFFNVRNSDCYEVWGMRRTGCVGCPFNPKVHEELAIIKQYEPKKYKACINLFGKSYDYHDRFKALQKETRIEGLKKGMFPQLDELLQQINKNEPTFMDY